jgi:hypothetical protein
MDRGERQDRAVELRQYLREQGTTEERCRRRGYSPEQTARAVATYERVRKALQRHRATKEFPDV